MKNIVRQCRACGKELIKRTEKWESNGKFLDRVYCDKDCRSSHEKNNSRIPPGGWGNSQTRRGFAKRAREFIKGKCEQCPAVSDLSIHHEDLNWKNNDPPNLRTLCRSCHSKWHLARGHTKTAGLPCRVCGEEFSYESGSRGELCNKHRLRLARHGSTDKAAPKPIPPCQVCGNPSAVKKRALCWAHYLQERKAST